MSSDVVLPTRQKLAGELLQFHYDKTKHLVNKKLSQHGFYGLVTDGWSNVNKDPVLNFILVNPTENIFVHSRRVSYRGVPVDGVLQSD